MIAIQNDTYLISYANEVDGNSTIQAVKIYHNNDGKVVTEKTLANTILPYFFYQIVSLSQSTSLFVAITQVITQLS